MTSSPTGPPSCDPEGFWIEREATGGGVIVRVFGSIDYATVEAAEEQLDAVEAALSPRPCWVLDLTGLSFLGSAGLALLVRYELRCQDRGNQFRVVAGNRAVLRLITLTGLDTMLTVAPSAEDAITTHWPATSARTRP